MKYLFIVLSLMLVALGAGCVSSLLQTEASTSGIRAAEELGAADVPQASFHLQLAKEELELAKTLSKKREYARGQSLLMRAEADAELAVALSREDAEKSEARIAVERVHQLMQDNP
jgi:hypothetical protein